MSSPSETRLYFRRRMEEGMSTPPPLPTLDLTKVVEDEYDECTPPTEEKNLEFPPSTFSVEKEGSHSTPLLNSVLFPHGTTCVATMTNGELGPCVLHKDASSECILQKAETEPQTGNNVIERNFSDGVRLRISVPKPPSTCLNVCFETHPEDDKCSFTTRCV